MMYDIVIAIDKPKIGVPSVVFIIQEHQYIMQELTYSVYD